MMFSDVNWKRFIELAAVWDGLSPETRQAFFGLTGKARTEATKFGKDLALMQKHRLLTNGQQQCGVHDDASDFSRLLRSFARHPLFTTVRPLEFRAYLGEHLSIEERRGFRTASSYYDSEQYLETAVTSVDWCQTFLRADNPALWERENQPKTSRYVPSPLNHSGVADTCRKLVSHLLAEPRPIPFADLPQLFQDDGDPEILAMVVRVCLRYLLLFAGLNDKQQPVIGLWPTVAERVSAPKPEPPATVQPDTEHSAANALEDLTTVLVAAAHEPLAMRKSDGELYAKVANELRELLLVPPVWLSENFVADQQDKRLRVALNHAIQMRLGAIKGQKSKFFTLETGERWIADTPQNRLKNLCDRMLIGIVAYWARDNDPRKPPVIPAAKQAYAWLDGRGFVPVHDFVQWRASTENPYIEAARSGKSVRLHSTWTYQQPSSEEMEREWARFLFYFLWDFLYPIDGIRFGWIAETKQISIALTEVGRYAVGLADDFEYQPQTAEAEIVVQPNFDIVFLSASPAAEIALTKFAERRGTGLGVLFRLTKPATFSAAAKGLTCAQVLNTLRTLSTKEIPTNVVREIKGWFSQCRRVKVKSAILIRCPDAETATRVLSVAGKQASLLTDTVIELTDAKSKQAIVKKLEKSGIFLDH